MKGLLRNWELKALAFLLAVMLWFVVRINVQIPPPAVGLSPMVER